ncbi:TetR/AcrR family transcriptional regulator [Pseudonocardia halophobica]|uniref:TetR/AcrR family transcriptional regulator n=1 Tax=Pseudonocardia halophobica TaxID=29401 RepID=UPI0005650C9A|nr:TetR/AcrR family transcriptional regulator [Pseudonocardia halophobica]
MDALSPLEAVWKAGPGTVGREGLSLARIVAAAVEIADAQGLDAVSMSRVAKTLGFTPMSLYRHVGSKEELLLHMQDVAVGPPPAELDPAPDAGWRECVERWAWATVHRMRAHPWILKTVPMLGPPATPNQLTWLEYGLRALRATPLAEPEKLYVILMLNAHTFGDLTFHEAETANTPEAAYETLFTRFLDPARFPALLEAFAKGAFAEGPDPAEDRDAQFRFGLDRILDGVARLIGDRAG